MQYIHRIAYCVTVAYAQHYMGFINFFYDFKHFFITILRAGQTIQDSYSQCY